MTTLRRAQALIIGAFLVTAVAGLIWTSRLPAGPSDLDPSAIASVRLFLVVIVPALALGVLLGGRELIRTPASRTWNNVAVIGVGAAMACLLGAIGVIFFARGV